MNNKQFRIKNISFSPPKNLINFFSLGEDFKNKTQENKQKNLGAKFVMKCLISVTLFYFLSARKEMENC